MAREISYFEIDPCYVEDSMTNGFSIVRNAFDPKAGSKFAERYINLYVADTATGNISERAPTSRIEQACGGALTEAIHEAFFQAGYPDWTPNQNVFMTKERSNPHQDNPTYRHGSAIVYLDGITEIQFAPTESKLLEDPVTEKVESGDIVLVRALDHSANYRNYFDPYTENMTDDPRTWHAARTIEGPRAMIHFGYFQTEDITYDVKTREPVFNTPTPYY